MRTILFLIVFALALILSLPFLLISWLFRDRDEFSPIPKTAVFICNHIVPLVVRLGGCNYTITGQENIPDEPVMFIGNHQGDFDVVMILYAFKRVPIIIAKWAAQKVPVAKQWMNLMHVIFIKKDDARQNLRCLSRLQEYLEHDFSGLIFPEGHRSQKAEMDAFKPGAFKAAVKAGVPIVPFVIDGTYKVFEQQRYLKKADVTFRILEPIYLTGEEKTTELSLRVHDLIEAELEKIRAEKNE